jgi:hypothetical protein
MVKVYASDMHDNPSGWPRARRLDALAIGLVASPDPLLTGAETATTYLLDGLAMYRYRVLAAYAAARPLFERALAIREKAIGSGHSDTATIHNNLGLLLYAQGTSPAPGRASSGSPWVATDTLTPNS